MSSLKPGCKELTFHSIEGKKDIWNIFVLCFGCACKMKGKPPSSATSLKISRLNMYIYKIGFNGFHAFWNSQFDIQSKGMEKFLNRKRNAENVLKAKQIIRSKSCKTLNVNSSAFYFFVFRCERYVRWVCCGWILYCACRWLARETRCNSEFYGYFIFLCSNCARAFFFLSFYKKNDCIRQQNM